MNIKAVIFDVDGTLINVEERFYHYYNVTLGAFGIESMNRDTYENKRTTGNLSDPIPDVGEMRGEFWFDFIDRFSYCDCDEIGTPFPGIPEALEELKSAGYKMAIVTGRNCEPNIVEDELKTLGINKYFQFILTNDDGLAGMNKAGKLLECAKKIGCAPTECAYIGDWEGDVSSAKEAKYGLVIAVLSGGEGRKALEKHGPDYILDGAAQTPLLLKKIN